MIRLTRLILLAVAALYMSGCTMTTVQYQPDFNLVNDSKDSELPAMSVGKFTEASPKVNKVSMRGSSMVSHLNSSYGAYLKYALEEQLKQSSLWSDSANVVISGTLTKNDFDASGTNIGTADLAADFIVHRDGNQVYQKSCEIHHEWPSAFMGSIAIPNAQNNYPVAVQKLIAELLSDPEFKAAIK